MYYDWVLSLREQCIRQNVSFEFRQCGTHFVKDGREYILHCIEYIKNNFSEKLTLDELAQMSAMSKSCFRKLFFELTGTSVNKFVNICRIRKSVEYIKKGYKITSIYGICGYEDFTTFYRNFKKIMGVSPNKYKNTLKKE